MGKQTPRQARLSRAYVFTDYHGLFVVVDALRKDGQMHLGSGANMETAFGDLKPAGHGPDDPTDPESVIPLVAEQLGQSALDIGYLGPIGAFGRAKPYPNRITPATEEQLPVMRAVEYRILDAVFRMLTEKPQLLELFPLRDFAGNHYMLEWCREWQVRRVIALGKRWAHLCGGEARRTETTSWGFYCDKCEREVPETEVACSKTEGCEWDHAAGAFRDE